MSFKIEKPGFYRERSGGKAQIVGQLSNGDWLGEGSDKSASRYNKSGIFAPDISLRESDFDLVAEWVEPKRIKGWIAIGSIVNGDIKPTCSAAIKDYRESGYSGKLLACIEIDVLEGAGLDGEEAK